MLRVYTIRVQNKIANKMSFGGIKNIVMCYFCGRICSKKGNGSYLIVGFIATFDNKKWDFSNYH